MFQKTSFISINIITFHSLTIFLFDILLNLPADELKAYLPGAEDNCDLIIMYL